MLVKTDSSREEYASRIMLKYYTEEAFYWLMTEVLDPNNLKK
jgi:hypothetical protein